MTKLMFVDFACFGHWAIAAKASGFKLSAASQANVYDPGTMQDAKDIHLGNPLPWADDKVWASHSPADGELAISDVKADFMGGSPPCVGFSGANPMARPDHPANRNFVQFFKDVKAVRPDEFLVEICEPIFTRGSSVLKEALRYVRGYHVAYKLFDVEDYGSPSVRRRPYFFGSSRLKPATMEEALELPPSGSVGCRTVLKDLERKFNRYEPDSVMLMSKYLADGKTLRNGPFRTLTDHKRTLDPELPAPTVTGFSVESAFHYAKGVEGERLIAVPEVKRLMGFPDSFKLNVNDGRWNAVKYSKVIASGVQIGFTSKLMRRVAKFI